MQKVQFRLLMILLVLLAAGLACNMPSTSSPTLPPTAVPMTTEEQQALQNQIEATLANPGPSGDVTLTITQQQLNAYLSAQMQNQQDQSITDPSVVLTNGHMEVYGKVSQNNLSAVAKIVLQPRVDEQGNVKLDVVSINLGPFPVPDAFKSKVQGLADNMLNDYIHQNNGQFKVKTVTVNEGSLTVTGAPQQ